MNYTLCNPITKEDLEKLRQAEYVAFRTDWEYGEAIPVITAIKEKGGDREHHTIKVGATIDLLGRSMDKKPRQAVISMHGPTWHPQLATIVSMLKLGDELILEWLADNSNGYVTHATYNDPDSGIPSGPIYRDELRLKVRRHMASGRVKVMRFNIQTGISPDNGARMIWFE